MRMPAPFFFAHMVLSVCLVFDIGCADNPGTILDSGACCMDGKVDGRDGPPDSRPASDAGDDAVTNSGDAGEGDAGEGDVGTPDAETADATAEPADSGDADEGCVFAPDAPLLLLYASVGDADNERLLAEDCEYQLVVGDKRAAPAGRITNPDLRARGGRSGHVLGGNGEQIRRWLREDGVEGTVERIQRRLDAGYDYIVIDEVTAHPEWADSHEISRRFRRVLDEIPEGSVIAYASIDLTQYSGGRARFRARKWVMRSLQRRQHRIGLEVYLHTGAVMGGAAPSAFREAADRLAYAVSGLTDAALIQRSAFIVLGTSLNSDYPQYRYLDQPAQDLQSVDRQVRALSESGARVGAQRGLGYYFVNRSDLTPSSSHPYDLNDLLDRLSARAREHLSAID